MDPRKLQFLSAVVGEDGARALSKAAERAAELDQAIFPRTIVAWLESVAAIGYEGEVPGTSVPFTFAKSEAGFDGSIAVNGELHRFKAASINHLAGCVAVALGLDHERVSPLAKNEQIARLGKSIDLLVKSHLVKTSWNVKQQRNVGPRTAEGRMIRYAQRVGLNPVVNEGSYLQQGTTVPYHPQSQHLGIDHELGHALMTAPGQTLGEHQQVIDKMLDKDHTQAGYDDWTADAVAHKTARRAGVAPSSLPGGSYSKRAGAIDDTNEGLYGLMKPAQAHVDNFDAGAKFDETGKLVRPNDVNAKINARAKLPMTKAALKPMPKKQVKLPGMAAQPIAPKQPIAPTQVQPANQKQAPAGAVGTSQATQLPKLPKVAATSKKTASVTKSEAQKKCQHCMRSQFADDKFKGCFCYAALAKGVKTMVTANGYALEFGAAWDQDAILSLLETFKGK